MKKEISVAAKTGAEMSRASVSKTPRIDGVVADSETVRLFHNYLMKIWLPRPLPYIVALRLKKVDGLAVSFKNSSGKIANNNLAYDFINDNELFIALDDSSINGTIGLTVNRKLLGEVQIVNGAIAKTEIPALKDTGRGSTKASLLNPEKIESLVANSEMVRVMHRYLMKRWLIDPPPEFVLINHKKVDGLKVRLIDSAGKIVNENVICDFISDDRLFVALDNGISSGKLEFAVNNKVVGEMHIEKGATTIV